MTKYKIPGMSVIDPSAVDEYIIPDAHEFIGYFPYQVESLKGYEKHFLGDLSRNNPFGVDMIWFSNIWDKKSESYLLGVYAGYAHSWVYIQSNTSIVRFSTNGEVHNQKSNSWAFVPKIPTPAA